MSERTCETCRWWNGFEGSPSEWACLRYPPTVIASPFTGAPINYRPRTLASEKCGEHQPKSKDTDNDA